MEYVIGCVGPRGAGKSTVLAHLGLTQMAQGGDVRSNMPISGEFAEGKFEAQPLTTDALFSFGNDFRRLLAILDEMQFYTEARESGTNRNKLINWLNVQIRKKEMSIAYSVQCFEWIDKRWQFQTDILIHCQDLAHTWWGRENHVARGEQLCLRYFDLSGAKTGRSARIYGKAYRQVRLYGKPLWGYFDSYAVIGMDEAFQRWTIRREEREISRGGNGHQTQIDVSELASVDRRGLNDHGPGILVVDFDSRHGPDALHERLRVTHRIAGGVQRLDEALIIGAPLHDEDGGHGDRELHRDHT